MKYWKEFTEWMDTQDYSDDSKIEENIANAQNKLEELKKKYNVTGSKT